MTPTKTNSHEHTVTITNEQIGALPLHAYKGNVAVVGKAEQLSKAFREISEHRVVGFDTETRPSFRKGKQYSVSLIQVAIPQKVFLIRLNLTGFHQTIVSFLENDAIVKSGVGLRDDLNALKKISPFDPRGFVDLAPLAKQSGLQVESVKKLTALLLGFRISKSAQTSNWEVEQLTQKQIEYAATDAWVCLELYHKLVVHKNG